MKTIKLTQGQVALVDDADYEAVSKFKWYALKDKKRGTFYAARSVWNRETQKHRVLRMHNFLFPESEEVNHKDGNGLNNRRSNLQPCSHLENTRAFRRRRKGVTSVFRGVSWRRVEHKWRAQVVLNGRSLHLGYFIDETDAARAYDTAARKYFGEFACPNFPL